MAPAWSGLLAVRTDDVKNEPRSHFQHGLLGDALRCFPYHVWVFAFYRAFVRKGSAAASGPRAAFASNEHQHPSAQ